MTSQPARGNGSVAVQLQPMTRVRWPFVAVVGIGFVVLTPPAIMSGTYSIFEASLVVLALALGAATFSAGVPPLRVPLPVPLLALLALMASSTLWSSASLYTLRDALTFGALAFAAWAIVRSGGIQTFTVGITCAGGLVLVASLLMLALDPQTALQYKTTAIDGIYANRNQMGYAMLQSLTAATAISFSVRHASVLRLILVVIFFGGVVLSQSRTSLVAACAVLAVWLFLILLRRSARYGLAFAGLGALALALIALNWSAVLSFLGKDVTLNGRSEIWMALSGLIREHALLGAGFLREWPGGSSQSVAVAERLGRQMVHAHSDALSWLSGVGAIGLGLVLSLYVFAFVLGWRIHHNQLSPGAIWLPLSMVMLTVHGLAETSATKPQGWFILMAVLFVCARFAAETLPGRKLRWLLLDTPSAHVGTDRAFAGDGQEGQRH